MKKLLLIGLLLAGGSVTRIHAQSVSDDITQLTLDIQKLSQMKSILSDMEKAYTIISGGYDGIKSIAEGNFNLHNTFLAALMQVSPVVQQYYKIASIVSNEAAIVKEYQAANGYFHSSGHFTDAELDYLSTMYTNLFNESVKNVDELTMIITAGSLRMSDAERLAAIDRIDRDVSGKLNFLKTFDNQTAIQNAQRAQNTNDAQAIQSLYGIGN
jgi:hypothetical protein